MAFGQEIKDFVSGFGAGYNISQLPDKREDARIEREYKRARTDYYDANTAKLREEGGLGVDFDEMGDRFRDGAAAPVTTTTGAPAGNTGLGEDDISAVADTARELGISPNDLAASISYETGGTFNPDAAGGKGGAHRGLIQFGPEEQKAYGYKPGMSFADQVRGPVKSYLKDRGVKPGYGVSEIYGIINAGSLDNSGAVRWDASDGNGSLRQHIDKINKDHLPRMATYFPVTTQGYGRGGAVRTYAEGGAVEEDEPVVPKVALDIDASLPLGPEEDTPEPEGTMAPAAQQGNAAPPTGSVSSGRKAVREGFKHIMDSLGLTRRQGVPDDTRRKAQQAYVRGYGSAKHEDMKKLYGIIDPKQEMSESELHMRSLGALYDYYSSKGEPEKAKNAAASALQYYRTISQRYLSVAKAAAEKGDMDGAIQATVRAYANIPDGRDLKIQKTDEGYAFQYTDLETGKAVTKGILSPQEIGALAMRVSPAEFDKFIITAAGQKLPDQSSDAFTSSMGALDVQTPPPVTMPGRDQAPEGAIGADSPDMVTVQPERPGMPEVDPKVLAKMSKEESDRYLEAREVMGERKPMKVPDRAGATEQLEAAWEGQLASMAGTSGTAPPMDPKETDELKGAAYSIYGHNKNTGAPSDVIRGVMSMTAVDPKNPKALNFGFKPERDGIRVEFKNGVSMFVPKEDFDRLVVLRGKKMKAALGQLEKGERSSARWDKLKKGLADAAATDYPNHPMPKEKTPEDWRVSP